MMIDASNYVGKWLWHKPTGLVDKAVLYYKPGDYVGIDGRPVTEGVIEFQSRNALLLRDGTDFVILDDNGVQMRWMNGVQSATASLVQALACEAAKYGIEHEFSMAVIATLLTEQSKLLR